MSNFEIYQPRRISASEYRDAVENGEGHNYIGPNNVILQVNYGCYLRCLPCDRWKWIDNGYDEENALSTRELVDLFAELSLMGTRKITIVGTEPVKRKDFGEVVTAIRTHGIKPEVYTAGIVLTNEHINAIVSSESDVAISIDGFNPETHNDIRYSGWRLINKFNPYELAIGNIQKIKQAREEAGLTSDNIHVFTNITLQKGNIGDLEKAGAAEIDAIGADSLRISIVHGDGQFVLTREDMVTVANFINRLKRERSLTAVSLSDAAKYILGGLITPDDFDRNILVPSGYVNGDETVTCRIGDFSSVISPNGDVYQCLYLYGDNLPVDYGRDNFKIGSIRDSGSFASIWNSEEYAVFRRGSYPEFQAGCTECTKCEYFEDFIALQEFLAGNDEQTVQVGW